LSSLLAAGQQVELVLAVGDSIVVELEALNEVAVLGLALLLLGLLLLLRLGLLLLGGLAVAASADDRANGLVGDLTARSEGHPLRQGAHQTRALLRGGHRWGLRLRLRLRFRWGHRRLRPRR
jgi:hypothetical protein